MAIVMRSKRLRVTKTRKTSAKHWRDVEVGDIIRFSQNVKGQGYGRGLYAVKVGIENFTKEDAFFNTMNQATNNMQGFEFAPVEEDE